MSRGVMLVLTALGAVVAGCGKSDSGAPAILGVAGEMVLIPAGTFTMGDGAGRPDETPHTVSVSSFYLDKYPVTQELYEKVMGVNPSKQKGKNNPVERTQWTDAVRFCNKCSELEGLTPCLRPGHLGVQLRRQRLPAAHRGGMGICLPRRQHREVLFRRRRDRAAAIRLVQAAFARQAPAGGPEAAQPLGPLRHARQRLAMVPRLVRRDLLRGESGGEPARSGHGQDARAARRRLGLHRREAAGRPTATRSSPFTPTPASAPTATASGGRGRPMPATNPAAVAAGPTTTPVPANDSRKQVDGVPAPSLSPAPGSGKIDLASLKGTIVFVSDRSGTMKIWSMHASGKDAKQLTKGTDPDADPRFSPDGKRILYTTLRGGFPEIWLMNRDGSEPKFVTKGSQGSWAPDGKSIVFIQDNQTFVRDLASGKERLVTPKEWERCGVPAFAPDGKHFAVASRHLGNIGIFILSLDGKENEPAQGRRSLLHAAMVEGRQEDPLPDGPGPHPPGRCGRQELGTVDLRRRRSARRPLLAGRDHDPVLPGTGARGPVADLPEKTGRRRRGVRASSPAKGRICCRTGTLRNDEC